MPRIFQEVSPRRVQNFNGNNGDNTGRFQSEYEEMAMQSDLEMNIAEFQELEYIPPNV
jgi:hypothetical protein